MAPGRLSSTPPPGAGQPPPPGPPYGQPPPPGYPYGQQPPPGYGHPAALKPHRGIAVLILGICGFVVCAVCGIIAWVMANNDLREMEAGTMDASGRELTNAGRLCGMISTIFTIVVFAFVILIMIVTFAGAAAAGA